jgi:pimeloyl-ACP methyl ester carboxylesterase
MKRQALMTWPQVAGLAAVITLLATAFVLWQRFGPRAVTVTAGTGPEELVYVRSSDDLINGGTIFMPPNRSSKQIAIIWIHGWGVNFYYPTYVQTGRATAALGYTFISANTRMHDLGNVAGWRGGKRIRAGGYWGVANEEVRDLAAWVDFAEERGFRKVILVGHSAGWSAVRTYQAEEQDSRVVGLVLASGAVRAETRPTDPYQLAEAKRLMAAGEGDALIRDPERSVPSYVSAATFLAIANSPAEYKDFFGVQEETVNPGVARIHCPLLALFGDRGDVGDESDLELLKSSIQRQSSGPSRVSTVVIKNADHMYTGEEAQIARAIAKWSDSVVLSQSGNRDVPGTD